MYIFTHFYLTVGVFEISLNLPRDAIAQSTSGRPVFFIQGLQIPTILFNPVQSRTSVSLSNPFSGAVKRFKKHIVTQRFCSRAPASSQNAHGRLCMKQNEEKKNTYINQPNKPNKCLCFFGLMRLTQKATLHTYKQSYHLILCPFIYALKVRRFESIKDENKLSIHQHEPASRLFF